MRSFLWLAAVAVAVEDCQIADEGTMLQVGNRKKIIATQAVPATQADMGFASASSDGASLEAHHPIIYGCPPAYRRAVSTWPGLAPLNDTSAGTARVRCCSMDGSSCTSPGCHTDKTFAEAQQICASEGLRLCTESEVLGRKCCGKGCGFDIKYIWASPPATWTLVLQYGEEAYPMNAGAVGVLNDDVNGFAKLSDEAINALPSGGEAGFDYYMFTSDPPEGASDLSSHQFDSAWDRMFLRTSIVGGYNDLDVNAMGIVREGASWALCNAASFDECTWRPLPVIPRHNFDTRAGSTTSDTCNRWFTGAREVTCHRGHNGLPSRTARCFSRGIQCSGSQYGFRANVKMYKLTGQ